MPHETDQSERPEICIGIDEFHTSKKISDYLVNSFKSKKYVTKINSPFAGSIVPLKYYSKNRNVQSVMIEVNRSLYMNEKGEKTKNFEKIKNDIFEIFFEGAPQFATPLDL